MARPEGSITKGYIANECMTFYSRYLKGIQIKFNRLEHNHNSSGQESKGEISIFAQLG